MKYTIIICLLFVLSNSLKEFNNKFSKEKSLLRSNYGSNIEVQYVMLRLKINAKL